MDADKWKPYQKDYRQTEIKYILSNIKSGDSVLIVSFPGCGKSTLLRYLSESPDVRRENPYTKFVYVDLNQLPKFEPLQLYKLILRELSKTTGDVADIGSNEELTLIDQIKA